MDLTQVDLRNTRIVLVEPAGARNVGSIARVMKNMGLTQLVIVNPECDHLGEEARRMAVHGIDRLESARVVPDLAAALEGCHRVAATIGRDGVPRSVETLRSVVPWLLGENEGLEFHNHGTPAKTNNEFVGEIMDEMGRERTGYLPSAIVSAIVFGREDHGLSNDQLKYAQRLVTIPSNPDYPSLNLAQSVGIVAYELYQATQDCPDARLTRQQLRLIAERSDLSAEPDAPFQMTEAFYLGLEALLLSIGYLHSHTADSRMQKFRLLLARAVPSTHEMTMLLGILRQSRWALEPGNLALVNPPSADRPIE